MPTLCPMHEGVCVKNHGVCRDVPGVDSSRQGTCVGQDKEVDGPRVGGGGLRDRKGWEKSKEN